MIKYYYDNEEDKVYTRMELEFLYEQNKADCEAQTFTKYLTAACEKHGTLTPLPKRWCVVIRGECDGVLAVYLSSTKARAEQLLKELFDDDVAKYDDNLVEEIWDKYDNHKKIFLRGDSITYTIEEVNE